MYDIHINGLNIFVLYAWKTPQIPIHPPSLTVPLFANPMPTIPEQQLEGLQWAIAELCNNLEDRACFCYNCPKNGHRNDCLMRKRDYNQSISKVSIGMILYLIHGLYVVY